MLVSAVHGTSSSDGGEGGDGCWAARVMETTMCGAWLLRLNSSWELLWVCFLFLLVFLVLPQAGHDECLQVNVILEYWLYFCGSFIKIIMVLAVTILPTQLLINPRTLGYGINGYLS